MFDLQDGAGELCVQVHEPGHPAVPRKVPSPSSLRGTGHEEMRRSSVEHVSKPLCLLYRSNTVLHRAARQPRNPCSSVLHVDNPKDPDDRPSAVELKPGTSHPRRWYLICCHTKRAGEDWHHAQTCIRLASKSGSQDVPQVCRHGSRSCRFRSFSLKVPDPHSWSSYSCRTASICH